ncbi:MAG: ComEC/Rec2 family competence protein [Deltaproteobacteria bacterium]|nr:ComEC/Rec2 family competence protein [Deltaproteobacteria bacterium]
MLWHKRFLFLFFLILIGIFRGIVWRPSIPNILFSQVHNICGTVGNPSEALEHLLIDQKQIKGRLQVFTWGRLPLKVGQRICFKAKIRQIKNFGTPGEFDFERYAAAQNIWGKVSLPRKVTITFHSEKYFYPVQSLRERFSFFLDRYSTGEILKALILGEKTGLSKQLQEDFVKSGLIHLLVVSGQNVSLLLLFFWSGFSIFFLAGPSLFFVRVLWRYLFL